MIITHQSGDESIRNRDDTPSFHCPSEPSSPVLEDAPVEAPPVDSLPDVKVSLVFRARAALYDDISSDDETAKSFDFTGELRALNKSGDSDRTSFVEQLENAFPTPAHLGYDMVFMAVSWRSLRFLPCLSNSARLLLRMSSFRTFLLLRDLTPRRASEWL